MNLELDEELPFGPFEPYLTGMWNNYIKKKINKEKSTPICCNNDSIIFANLYSLNNYNFLSFSIVGNFKVNSNSPAKMAFNFDSNNTYEIESDDEIIKSDYSYDLKLGITKFDIELSNELSKILKSSTLNSINIEFKTVISLKKIKRNNFENIHQPNVFSIFKKMDTL